MSLLDQAARRVDNADLVCLALVEHVRGRDQQATAAAIAAAIKGAPPAAVARKLAYLTHLGLLEVLESGYAVTLMGAELLLREVGGWEPAPREMERRDRFALSASAGAIAPRRR